MGSEECAAVAPDTTTCGSFDPVAKKECGNPVKARGRCVSHKKEYDCGVKTTEGFCTMPVFQNERCKFHMDLIDQLTLDIHAESMKQKMNEMAEKFSSVCSKLEALEDFTGHTDLIRHVACTLFALYYVNHQTQSEIFGAEEQMEVRLRSYLQIFSEQLDLKSIDNQVILPIEKTTAKKVSTKKVFKWRSDKTFKHSHFDLHIPGKPKPVVKKTEKKHILADVISANEKCLDVWKLTFLADYFDTHEEYFEVAKEHILYNRQALAHIGNNKALYSQFSIENDLLPELTPGVNWLPEHHLHLSNDLRVRSFVVMANDDVASFSTRISDSPEAAVNSSGINTDHGVWKQFDLMKVLADISDGSEETQHCLLAF